MIKKDITNVSFQWAAILLGSVGAELLGNQDLVLGAVFVLLALGILVVREVLKKYGIDVKNKK